MWRHVGSRTWYGFQFVCGKRSVGRHNIATYCVVMRWMVLESGSIKDQADFWDDDLSIFLSKKSAGPMRSDTEECNLLIFSQLVPANPHHCNHVMHPKFHVIITTSSNHLLNLVHSFLLTLQACLIMCFEGNLSCKVHSSHVQIPNLWARTLLNDWQTEKFWLWVPKLTHLDPWRTIQNREQPQTVWFAVSAIPWTGWTVSPFFIIVKILRLGGWQTSCWIRECVTYRSTLETARQWMLQLQCQSLNFIRKSDDTREFFFVVVLFSNRHT